MSQYTENYHLEKPESNDDFENFRENYNSNMDIIDANLGGGGGGSSVSWSQLQVTGDKIATITVSGIPQDVFAPNSQTFTIAVSRANINSGETYSTIFGKIKKWFNDLKTVAFSGSYNDLTDKPTIPTVNDGTLTIQQNGTIVGTFSANQSGNTTVNLTGGGGSAHTIVNESGTALADEPNLQFTDGLKATDDSVNSKTVVGVNTTFTEASTRTNIASGDTFATILGKIKKFFTDLKTVAFSGSYNDLSDKPTIPVGSDYVQKSGDTMTGQLNINNSSDTPLILKKTNASTGKVYVGFANSAETIGYFSVGADKKPYFASGNGTDKQIALTSDVDAKVSKSGDTMTGNLIINRANTTTTAKNSEVELGNNIADGTAGSSYGRVIMYGNGTKYTILDALNSTGNRTIHLPDKGGTVALTDDIPDISTKVSKSGDTMSGDLTFQGSSNDSPDVIFRYGNGNEKLRLWTDDTYTSRKGINYRIYKNDGTSIYSGQLATVADIPTNNNQLTNGAGYITADGTSKTAKMLFSQTDNMGFYETNDTHILKLGYIKADDYSNITILVSSSFYGVQHGSTDILNVIQDYTRSSRYFYRIRLDNRTNRRFFGEQVGDKFYIWVYVNGGNSYGQWNVSVIQTNNNNIDWVDEKAKNQPTRSTWTEFGYSGTVYQATANVLKSGDTMTGDLTVEGTLTAYNFMNLYSDVFEKQITISLPTSLTANRNVSFPNKGGTIAMTSDISSRRYKENIIPLSDDEAKKILDVEIVNYDYKENVVDEDERYDQKGAIAEDVVNLIPNAVTYADIDGEQLPDGINYTKFIPYLIKMVQMQQKEIEELKAMIKEE